MAGVLLPSVEPWGCGVKGTVNTGMRVLRNTKVRDLTQQQCLKLLYHHHGLPVSDMRKKAYLLKAAGSDWPDYFDGTQASHIQAWIERE